MFKSLELLAVVVLVSWSALFLVGLYRYSGSIFPNTEGTGAAETLAMWILWGAFVLPPVAALIWRAIRTAARR